MNQWQTKSIANCFARAAAAEPGSPDQAVLIREAVRLSGGDALSLPVDLRTAGLTGERFGLSIDSGPHSSIARIVRWAPDRDVPVALADELLSVLRVDPEQRRVHSPAAADGVLLRNTPFVEYRNLTQKAAVRAALTMPPASTLLVRMSTGTGKSLLFQLAAMFEREKYKYATVVVLVPTIALALDQARGALAFEGLKGSCALTSQDSLAERDEKLQRFAQGRVPILFLSPEMALGKVQEHLERVALPLESPDRKLAARAHIVSIFVDEAHIVASWGKSFRPELQRIPGLIESLRKKSPDLRTVLLSATVDVATRELLLKQYVPRRIDGETFLEVVEGVARTEFDLVAHQFSSHEARRRALLALVDYLPRPALIYTTQVEDANTLGKALANVGGYKRTAVFTGDTLGHERQRIIHDWRDGNIDIVVGTSAFGMGIDNSGVRAVVHACLPEGASRYYQEIGRAGRDGHQALAMLLHVTEDKDLAVRLAVGQVLKDAAPSRWRDLVWQRQASTMSTDHGMPWELDLRVPADNSYNRRWNQSLMVQLQRYGALEVMGGTADPDDHRDKWTVVAKAGFEGILDTETAVQELARAFECREEEESTALDAVRQFADLWRTKSCVLTKIYELVEEGALARTPCGRCPACRRAAVLPSPAGPLQIRTANGPRLWSWSPGKPTHSRVLHCGSNEIAAGHWIAPLVQQGVQQLLLGFEATRALQPNFASLVDWITVWEELQQVPPIPAPTAIAVSHAWPEDVLRSRFLVGRTWHAATRRLAWWVSPRGTVVDERHIEDVVSNQGPITLSNLLLQV